MLDALKPEFILSLVVSSVVTTICGAIIGYLISKVKNSAAHHKEAMDVIKKNREEDEQIQLITLRMAIYDEHFDLDEKLEAYDIYRNRGGNHKTKKYMDEKLGTDVDDFLDRRKKN